MVCGGGVGGAREGANSLLFHPLQLQKPASLLDSLPKAEIVHCYAAVSNRLEKAKALQNFSSLVLLLQSLLKKDYCEGIGGEPSSILHCVRLSLSLSSSLVSVVDSFHQLCSVGVRLVPHLLLRLLEFASHQGPLPASNHPPPPPPPSFAKQLAAALRKSHGIFGTSAYLFLMRAQSNFGLHKE